MNGTRSHPNPLLTSLRPGDGVPGPNLWYRFARCVLQVAMGTTWKVRVFDRHYEPAEGGAVYISNHQSFLDPMLMSLALRRPMNYMARHSLFRTPGFKQLIESLNAFPVRRGTADTGAMKEAMRRIKKGGQVVVFAEGTRTRDGRIGPFLPGVALLAQRTAKWTVPVLIDGAFEAWPRSSALPGMGSIVIRYAPPISQSDARDMSPDELVTRVRDTIIAMQTETRRRTGRPRLEYA
jgi:1-acyl-sn-glycerol-3-phosphate acyltransferase